MIKTSIIGIASPARYSLENLENGLKEIKEKWNQLGYELTYYPSCYVQNYFETVDGKKKAEELLASFADDSQLVMALRGGYSTNYCLDYVDFKTLAKHPKMFVGHSDLSLLLNHIYLQAGIVTWHGPLCTAVNLDDNYSYKLLSEIVNGDCLNKQLPSVSDTLCITKGIAYGTLLGGNLSLVCMAIGTKWQLPLEGNILLLEDLNEPDFKIDGLFWQLTNAYDLSKCKGIIFGNFMNCQYEQDEKRKGIIAIVKAYFANLNIPVMFNYSSGHEQPMTSLPIGGKIKFNAETGLVEIIEAIVY